MTNTNQSDHKSIPAKRVNIVSVKLCRESSLLYKPRYISTPKDAAVLVKDFLIIPAESQSLARMISQSQNV